MKCLAHYRDYYKQVGENKNLTMHTSHSKRDTQIPFPSFVNSVKFIFTQH